MDLIEKINRLSTMERKEVEDFVDFLLAKERKRKNSLKKIRGIIAGKISDFNAVELQHKVLEWGTGGERISPGHKHSN
ncbi:DUF2281 domain-containing protein [Thermosipho ferrireducens]|uniref:DUF2281 domain-containing protein n=1 Tax=Thermosipho ferrireducens TaxID=2571116 RepID=A0ABX7S793_9BACT|nr:DUF2281 domain-containing protein [Thermosipho ferrireducens]QTA38469.1 DUF2281 domain-containing protein [Thermosipho ferrireducens]